MSHTLNGKPLSEVPTADLVAFYNERLGKSIKKFQDRATAEAKVAALLDSTGAKAAPVESKGAPAPKAPKAPKAAVKLVAGGRRRARFNFEAREDAKRPRPGTTRAVACALLERDGGATLEEVMEQTGWTRRDALDGVRLLAIGNGLGLTESVDGGRFYVTV